MAYGFSDTQIEQLINSSIHSPITFITPNNSDLSVASTEDPRSHDRPGDDGVGYEVLSTPGFHTATAYVTLPDVYTGNEGNNGTGDDVNAFMFWTLNEKIDVGLGYAHGTYGNKWRFTWLYAGTGQGGTPPASQDCARLQEVDDLYIRVMVTDDEWLQFEILNANNFNETIATYVALTEGLNITRSNAQWRRQISLCTSEEDANENVVFDGGAYMRGAEFSDCYLYTDTFYTPTIGNYVDEDYCGIFGIDETSSEYVDIVNHSEWDYEKINIQFPQ